MPARPRTAMHRALSRVFHHGSAPVQTNEPPGPTPDQLACGAVVLLLLVMAALPFQRASAQAPLILINEDTRVRDVSFKFAETQTFETDALLEQVAVRGPSFWATLQGWLPFVSTELPPFDPIELQRDVVRLRRYYRNNGFLHPDITYAASQLDTTDNTIHVIFSIDEGPPLIIQDVAFFGPDGGYAADLFEEPFRERWIRFRDRTSLRTGIRYTEFRLLRIQDLVLNWLRERGYAFARVEAETDIDPIANTVDVRFIVDPGPRGYVSEILIEGNDVVEDHVILRELPFSVGDLYEHGELVQGQRELFGLNLFRLALVDVPPTFGTELAEADTLLAAQVVGEDEVLRQPRDSTVLVRVRVREAELRYLFALTGYSRNLGIALEGQWMHRNFLGGARTLTLNATANTGFLAAEPFGNRPPRRFSASVSVNQPFLFTTRLSSITTLFGNLESDPLLQESEWFLDVNRREYGISNLFVYQLFPFRTISLEYRLSQASQLTSELRTPRDGIVADTTRRDFYSKSILTLNSTFGWTDDFLNPTEGILIRPLVEQAGAVVRSSGIQYVKTGVEAVGYVPVTPRINVAARLFAGRVWPFGRSAGSDPIDVDGDGTPEFVLPEQFTQPTEDRFDPIRFYAGGPNDVRGWALRLLGPKLIRVDFARDTTGAIIFEDGLPQTDRVWYESIGGLGKLAANLEVRLPAPFLNNDWSTAVFLDFGQVSAEAQPDPDCEAFIEDPLVVVDPGDIQCGFRDEGNLSLLGRFKYGTGLGIRYQTPVGFIRVDLAFKINPDRLDLQQPRDAYLYRAGFIDEQRTRFIRRFNLHISIGQAF